MIFVESAVSFLWNLQREKKALYELTSKKANLEDIFLELTEAADPADVPEKDSEQVKADLRDMEISGLEEIGGLEKDETERKNTGIKRNRKRRRKQNESSIKT